MPSVEPRCAWIFTCGEVAAAMLILDCALIIIANQSLFQKRSFNDYVNSETLLETI